MRLLCPSCSEPIQVPDEVAGKVTQCVLCGAEIAVPPHFAATAAWVHRPPTSSANPLQIDSSELSQTPPVNETGNAMNDSSSSNATCTCGITLQPTLLQWVVPILLGLVVVLTLFFSWSGAFPGDHAVYTQGAFSALLGRINIDPDGENVLRANPTNPPEGVTPLKNQIGSNWLLLFIIPLIFLSFVVAVLACIEPMMKVKLPAAVTLALPWKWTVVLALSGITFFLLAVQAYRGFGLERAIWENAKQEVERTNKLPEYPSTSDYKRQEIQIGTIAGRFQVGQTTALRLTLFLLLLAALVSAFLQWMALRPGRPAPRIEIRC